MKKNMGAKPNLVERAMNIIGNAYYVSEPKELEKNLKNNMVFDMVCIIGANQERSDEYIKKRIKSIMRGCSFFPKIVIYRVEGMEGLTWYLANNYASAFDLEFRRDLNIIHDNIHKVFT